MGIMVIDPYRFAGEELLLDLYPDAAFALSLRKINSSYAGDCIRVRRSSDNAEQDIGFASGVLDESALTTFTGANDGFVVTWYDQSGNGIDFTQSIASRQPQIVSAGTMYTQGGVASMNYSSNTLIHSGTIHSPASDYTFSVVAYNTAGSGRIMDSQTGRFILDAPSNGVWFDGSYQGTGNTFSARELRTYLVLNSGGTVRIDGSDDETGISYTQQTLGGDTGVGGFYTGGGSYISGLLQEIICWPDDLTSDISDIETNVNDFHSVY